MVSPGRLFAFIVQDPAGKQITFERVSTHYFFPTQTNPFLPLESELVTTFIEATNKEVLPGIASMIIIEIQSAPIQINDLIIVQ